MTVIALAASIIISIGSLAMGFAVAGFVIFARWILIFGAVWLFTQWRSWSWFSSLGLFVSILLSAIGVWVGLPSGWMFSGSIFALCAWDMTDFRRFASIFDEFGPAFLRIGVDNAFPDLFVQGLHALAVVFAE